MANRTIPVEATLNHAPCGFLTFDDQGRILEMNATLLEQLGFEAGQLIGAKIETILTIAGRIFYQTHLFPLLALHGQVKEIFVTLQARDKREIPMLLFAKRNQEQNDCVLVPVPERQKYEQEILAAKRAAEEALRSNQELLAAKSQLQAHAQELDRRTVRAEQKSHELHEVANILFHDLREPIRKIETFSSMLLAESDLEKEAKSSVSKISSACTRASLLLRALQQFVSVEMADDVLEQVNLNDLVVTTYQQISQAHPKSPGHLSADVLPEIQGYSRQLRLLFEQLFQNAFRFGRAGVPVEIQVSAVVVQENSFQSIRGRYHYIDFAQIFVRDNGMGIPQEYRGSVFELLKKLDPTNPGPGCGLAICRKVVSNHYGSIMPVQQPAPGTAFKILLPVKQEQFPMESE